MTKSNEKLPNGSRVCLTKARDSRAGRCDTGVTVDANIRIRHREVGIEVRAKELDLNHRNTSRQGRDVRHAEALAHILHDRTRLRVRGLGDRRVRYKRRVVGQRKDVA